MDHLKISGSLFSNHAGGKRSKRGRNYIIFPEDPDRKTEIQSENLKGGSFKVRYKSKMSDRSGGVDQCV